MRHNVALLLDGEHSLYQQELAAEARVRAARRSLDVGEAQFADGSAMGQMEQLLGCLNADPRPDGVLLVPAGRQSQLPACRRLVKAGLSIVFLNRVPDYMDALRQENPDVLVAAVAPHQAEIGRIQADQLARVSRGGLALLITGTQTNESTIGRRRGFEEAIPKSFDLHVLEGDWSDESGYQAIRDWFRLGARRDEPIQAVVCQNDEMAVGARRALRERAAEAGTDVRKNIPVLGCDGLAREGQRLVSEGVLSSTVIMPTTTGRALDLLAAFWDHGSRADVLLLAPASYPAVDAIQSA